MIKEDDRVSKRGERLTEKVALFAFNGDPDCFIHVLLNTLDMRERGFDVSLIIEGSATKLIPQISSKDHPLNGLYLKVKESSSIDCVCRACANKMGALESAERENLPVCGPMSGHPPLGDYIEKGYQVMVF
jgi:hypothetical protein